MKSKENHVFLAFFYNRFLNDYFLFNAVKIK